MGEVGIDETVGDIGSTPTCRTCGSQRVVKDAWASWNPVTGLWELENVFDQEYCHRCEGETHFVWTRMETVPNLRIRELNDRFRREGVGNGSVVITPGVLARGQTIMQKAVEAIESFDDFKDENDPWGEHDFGVVEVEGERVFWKFDYYSPDLCAGSDNPANEGLTHRVLTIMLTSEY